MKKTAIIFLIAAAAVFALTCFPCEASYAAEGKVLPPENVSLVCDGTDYYVIWEAGYNEGFVITINGANETLPKDCDRYLLSDCAAGKTYAVKIKTIAPDGRADSDFSEEKTFVIPLKLSSPENIAVSDEKILTFDAVNGALSYKVVVNGVKIADGTTETSIDLNPYLKSSGGYLIKVMAQGDNEHVLDGKFSSLYYVNEPELTSPANLSVCEIDGEVIVSWDSVPYATGYEITVNGNTQKTELNQADITDKVLVADDYNIKVCAVSDAGFKSSGYSEITYSKRVELSAPLLLASETGNRITWEKEEGASLYAVTLTFMGKIIDERAEYSDTFYDLTDALTENGAGEYVLSVAALSNGNYDYSDTAYYTHKEFCKLAAPEITLSGTTVSWDAVENAADYKVCVDGRVVESNLGATSFEFSDYIAESKTYLISVSCNANGWYLASDATDIEYKNTVKLGTPDVTADKSVVSWTEVLGATSYDVTIDGEFYVNTAENSINLGEALTGGKEYVIGVRAKADGYETSDEKTIVVRVEEKTVDTLKYSTALLGNEDKQEAIIYADGEKTDYKFDSDGYLVLPSDLKKVIIVLSSEYMAEKVANANETGGDVELYAEINLEESTYNANSDSFELKLILCEFGSWEIVADDGADEADFITVDGINYYYHKKTGGYMPFL